jgi:hypothetical protein
MVPMPSMVVSSTSPACRNVGGWAQMPVPAGVPVKTTSPGNRGQMAEILDSRSGTVKTRVGRGAVLDSHPVDLAPEADTVGVGQLIGRDQPRADGAVATVGLAQRELAGGGELQGVGKPDLARMPDPLDTEPRAKPRASASVLRPRPLRPRAIHYQSPLRPMSTVLLTGRAATGMGWSIRLRTARMSMRRSNSGGRNRVRWA